MQNLQIQDAFKPYYSGRSKTREQTKVAVAKNALADRTTLSAAEIRARLEACRERLARAIAADAEPR